MTNKVIPLLVVLALLASCSDVKEVGPSDWKRYDWMRDVLGEEIKAESARLNLDTGEYRFVFTTTLPPDSAIAGFDERAARSGWQVQKKDILSRIYTRRNDSSPHGSGYGCISIQPRQGEGASQFRFLYRQTSNC